MENNVQKESDDKITLEGIISAILVYMALVHPLLSSIVMGIIQKVFKVNIPEGTFLGIAFYPMLVSVVLIVLFGPFLHDD